jgi:hypothetical protein
VFGLFGENVVVFIVRPDGFSFISQVFQNMGDKTRRFFFPILFFGGSDEDERSDVVGLEILGDDVDVEGVEGVVQGGVFGGFFHFEFPFFVFRFFWKGCFLD